VLCRLRLPDRAAKSVRAEFEAKSQAQKSPNESGLIVPEADQLLDLGFLEDHVLTDLGIKLLDLHFFRHGALVLRGRVEIAGASSGH
jgi:hypothetical protein